MQYPIYSILTSSRICLHVPWVQKLVVMLLKRFANKHIYLQIFIDYRYQFNSERINCEKMLKVDDIMVWRVKLHCIILNIFNFDIILCSFARSRGSETCLLCFWNYSQKQTNTQCLEIFINSQYQLISVPINWKKMFNVDRYNIVGAEVTCCVRLHVSKIQRPVYYISGTFRKNKQTQNARKYL